MISVAKTVVNEGAVVVVQLNAPATLVAMERCLSLYHFAVRAKRFKYDSRVDCFVDQLNEVNLFLDEARVECN
jgi:hypothetical protein